MSFQRFKSIWTEKTCLKTQGRLEGISIKKMEKKNEDRKTSTEKKNRKMNKEKIADL